MHLTDEQLNEYLDHEANDRVQIELHLATCEECSARLMALRDLFSEIASLPDVGLSPEFAMRFTQSPGSSTTLPPSLALTMTLQAVLTVVAIVVAAPFVMQFVSSNSLAFSLPSFVDVIMHLQSQWIAWLDTLSTLTFPPIPEIPVVNMSGLYLTLMILGVSLLWLIGNGLLLKNQMK